MAYAVDSISIEGISIELLETLELHCKPFEHGIINFSGYVNAETGEQLIYRVQEQSKITVLAEGKKIFSGIITAIKVSGKGNTSYVEVEGKTYSMLMDQKKKSRSFQRVSMTYKELATELLSEYAGAQILFSMPDVAIGEIAIQYRETDWQFLKRMLSMQHIPITCVPTADTIQLYAGVLPIPSKHLSYQTIGFRKELGEYQYWLQEGANIRDDNFLMVEIETKEIPELFEQVEVAGQKLVVAELFYQLKEGLLSCICKLQKTKGILAKKEYPMHLIGVALEGEVKEVSGIQVKIHLGIDGNRPSEDVYWFPFSTLSASQDGSGWYYMPEIGDKVRVYFPTKYTKDVIAIGAVSSYDGTNTKEPDRMAEPSTKYLRNPSGQEIKMGEDGMTLSCNGGIASVFVGNSGDISLYAAKTLSVEASNTITMDSEMELELFAEKTAVVSCVKGGCIQMQPEGVLLVQGTQVHID